MKFDCSEDTKIQMNVFTKNFSIKWDKTHANLRDHKKVTRKETHFLLQNLIPKVPSLSG